MRKNPERNNGTFPNINKFEKENNRKRRNKTKNNSNEKRFKSFKKE